MAHEVVGAHEHPSPTIAQVLTQVHHAPVFRACEHVVEDLLSTHEWPSLEALSRVAGIACEAERGGGRRRGLRHRSELYDARITEQRRLPTRLQNWHDLFNAVAWATFPLAKRALHARQYRRLCERVPERFTRLPGARTSEQGALTQLDEGGVLLCVPGDTTTATIEALTETLRALVIQRAPLRSEHLAPSGARVRVFGHALYEHLALGSPTPRAAVRIAMCPPAELDRALAYELDDDATPFVGASASAWITPDLATHP